MSDWTPAVLRSLSFATIIFDADDTPVMRTFDSASAAAEFAARAGIRFEYSAELNAARNRAGDVLELPALAAPQRFVDHPQCALTVNGHCPHPIPALRAANGPAEDWQPVEYLGAQGQKIILATSDEILTVYHHAPEQLRDAVEINQKYKILRGAGTGRRSCFMYSKTPIGPCIG